MTLKEELEVLRREPIQIWEGDPKNIPCIETSDSKQLCKHPVVSVNMITYNHEPYIREAIEGVMMQKTDFEFELVIGEDCSTDRTREICFEYQKKYPDKIRVLWCDHNLYRNPHPAGGNAERNLAHCRGELIAICEGDDYWIDPLKLQKQVDVMRKYPNVGLCFCGARNLELNTGRQWRWNAKNVFPQGNILGLEFFNMHLFGAKINHPGDETFLMTASTMIRKSVFENVCRSYNIFSWRLRLGDTTLWLGVASLADVYYLPDEVSVYRRTATGACGSSNGGVFIDACIVRAYFAVRSKSQLLDQWLQTRRNDPLRFAVLARISQLPPDERKNAYKRVLSCLRRFDLFGGRRLTLLRMIIFVCGVSERSLLWCRRLYKYLPL